MPAKSKRRFQFSLRTLFLLITAAAFISAVLGRVAYLHQMAAYHEDEGMRYGMEDAGSFEDAVSKSIAAAQHFELAGRYRYATWRPWTIVDTVPPDIDRKELSYLEAIWPIPPNSQATTTKSPKE